MGVGVEPPADFRAVDVRQAHVEQHQIGIQSKSLLDGLRPRVGFIDLESAETQILRVGLAVVTVVIDDQNAWGSYIVSSRRNRQVAAGDSALLAPSRLNGATLAQPAASDSSGLDDH